MNYCNKQQSDQKGFALITTLAVMAILAIVVTAFARLMMSDVVLADFQYSTTRAFYWAAAGVDEAIFRMENSYPYQAFSSSPEPNLRNVVTVATLNIGSGAAVKQINSEGIWRSTKRRVYATVIQASKLLPSNITEGEGFSSQGSATIQNGDVYSRTYAIIKKKEVPTAPSQVYAGYTITLRNGKSGQCYRNGDPACQGIGNLWPVHRLATYLSSPLGADIAAQTLKCPEGGGGSLPSDSITGIMADKETGENEVKAAYGFDLDDGKAVRPDLGLPCGLPYKYVVDTFSDPGGNVVSRIRKYVVFEQWFRLYFQFNEGTLSWEKTGILEDNPRYGAVPPFPDINLLTSKYDIYASGGQIPYLGAVGDPKVVVLSGDYTLTGNITGSGVLIVVGDLTLAGNFQYWGTIFVNGKVTIGSGTPKIHGGLVARDSLSIIGNLTVDAGTNVDFPPVGPSDVIKKAWWTQ